MRVFVGIELDDRLKSQIKKLQKKLMDNSIGGKWKEPSNLHLTVKYLGEVNDISFERVERALKNYSRGRTSFLLKPDKIDFFYKKDKIKVMWLGLRGDLIELQSLYSGVESSLKIIGFENQNRAYIPHITLAQNLKLKDGCEMLPSFLEDLDIGNIKVDKISIFESTSKGGKLEYNVLNRCFF